MAKDKSEYEVTMTFDGEEVGMMPFVEGMVRDVVLGLAENLKGYEEGMEIVTNSKKVIISPSFSKKSITG